MDEDYSKKVVELFIKHQIGFNLGPDGIIFHSITDKERAEDMLMESPYWEWWINP